MPQINLNITDDLDKEFRKKVFEKKGLRKGAMTEAIIEALGMWMEQEEKKKK